MTLLIKLDLDDPARLKNLVRNFHRPRCVCIIFCRVYSYISKIRLWVQSFLTLYMGRLHIWGVCCKIVSLVLSFQKDWFLIIYKKKEWWGPSANPSFCIITIKIFKYMFLQHTFHINNQCVRDYGCLTYLFLSWSTFYPPEANIPLPACHPIVSAHLPIDIFL